MGDVDAVTGPDDDIDLDELEEALERALAAQDDTPPADGAGTESTEGHDDGTSGAGSSE